MFLIAGPNLNWTAQISATSQGFTRPGKHQKGASIKKWTTAWIQMHCDCVSASDGFLPSLPLNYSNSNMYVSVPICVVTCSLCVWTSIFISSLLFHHFDCIHISLFSSITFVSMSLCSFCRLPACVTLHSEHFHRMALALEKCCINLLICPSRQAFTRFIKTRPRCFRVSDFLLLCVSAEAEWKRLKVDGRRTHLYSWKQQECADGYFRERKSVEISFYCLCVLVNLLCSH